MHYPRQSANFRDTFNTPRPTRARRRRRLSSPRSRRAWLAAHGLLLAAWAAQAQNAATPAEGTNSVKKLPDVVVKGQDEPSYAPSAPALVGRNDIPQLENARTTQIFTRKLLDDLNPQTLDQILTRAPNVTSLGNNDGRGNLFLMRGFEAPILKDGFRIEEFGAIADPEIYGMERIEILKGPDSVGYGEASPGGLINLVSKRPLGYRHAEVGLEFGSYYLVSPRFDFGGRVGPAASEPEASGFSADYRLVGLYRYFDGWREYDTETSRFYGAPSVRLNFSERTSLTLLAEIMDEELPADFGTAVNSDGSLALDRDLPNNHPQDSLERYQRLAGYDFGHEFDGGWTVGNRFRYFDNGYEFSSLLLPFTYDEATGLYTRVPAQQEQASEEFATQINLSGDHDLFGRRNRLFTGVDLRKSTVENSTRFDPSRPFILDVNNPDYSAEPPPASALPEFVGGYQNDEIYRAGAFVQDHFNVTEKLILSGGTRFDFVERDPIGVGVANIEREWSSQAGVVYQLTEHTSLFGNYSESFTPSFVLDRGGNVLEPETGAGFEVGAKARLWKERLFASLSYFDAAKENVATTDPVNPLFSVAAGEVESRGVELNLHGEIVPGWMIVAGYGYIDAEISEDNPGLEGNRVFGVPFHTASVWSRYTLQEGALAGLGFGFGARYTGDRWVDNANTVRIDEYVVLTAGLFYNRQGWAASVLVDNLTDEEYVQSAWGATARSVYAGAPVTVTASLAKRF